MVTDGDHNGKGLARAEVAIQLLTPMLTRHHVQGTSLLVVHHHAIGTQIDPIRVQILGDHHTPGPDVTPPVQFMPLGNGKLQEIDFIA